jgi:hypothetical protein
VNAVIRNTKNPKAKVQHRVRCEGCDKFGPVVRLTPAEDRELQGHELAESAAVEKGWLIHHETVRTPVRKWPTSAFQIQHFCGKCQKQGMAGKFPAYNRPAR